MLIPFLGLLPIEWVQSVEYMSVARVYQGIAVFGMDCKSRMVADAPSSPTDRRVSLPGLYRAA